MESTQLKADISTVPNEILKKILSYLPTKELLYQFRLVNTKWWEYSTEICHKSRSFKLKSISDQVTNSSPPKVPWSFYSYKQRRDDAASFDQLKEFLMKCGTHILEMEIREVELERLGMDVLAFIPNVQHLLLYIWNGGFRNEDQPTSTPCYAPLLHLKSLDISGITIASEAHVDWCAQLFGKCSLAKISLTITQGWSKEVVSMAPIINVLKKIPRISLSLSSDTTGRTAELVNPFISSGIRLAEFGFWVAGVGYGDSKEAVEPGEGYKVMEKLLENSAETIENLRMGGSGGTDEVDGSAVTFNFPVLPKLKFLKMNFPATNTQFLTQLFSDLTPFQVPALETIKIEDMIFPPPSGPAILFTKTLVFETVRELWIKSSYRFFHDWSKMFPNLRKLKAKIVWEPREVQTIYNLKYLEHLQLQAFVRDEYAGEGSQCFSGIPVTESIQNKTDEEIVELRGRQENLPCIRELTRLQNLKIEFLRNSVELNESVEWTLLKMPPLQQLELKNAKLSDAMKTKLATHHTMPCKKEWDDRLNLF